MKLLVLRPTLIFGVDGLGWQAPEYSKGVVNRTPSRPSSTQGRATEPQN